MSTIHCEVSECIANKDGECQAKEIWLDKQGLCEQVEFDEEEWEKEGPK